MQLIDEWEVDLKARADGGDLSPGLFNRIRIFRLAALDESIGEGYHARTHREKLRASASSYSHLKRMTRHKENLRRIRAFMKRFGQQAEDVVRYDWWTFKRIGQSDPRKRWKPKKISTKRLYARIYREDAFAETDWKSICAMRQDEGRVHPEDVSNRVDLENEYIHASVSPGNHYSANVPTEVTGPDDELRVQEEPVHFEVVRVACGNSRPHLMHTVEFQDDVVNWASLALNVLFHARRIPDVDDVPSEGVHVFPTGEPEWIVPSGIGPFERWQNVLQVYKDVQDSEYAGCLVLRGDQRA